MAITLTFDTKDFEAKAKKLVQNITAAQKLAITKVADEILRLSAKEVPLNEGGLLGSGTREPDGDEMLVGYNKPYAARLHEHPEYRFQNGRKGKYLEDPIKHNSNFLLSVLGGEVKKAL